MNATEIYALVMAAMQHAEEIGGPEGSEYIELMDAIALEAQTRSQTCREIIAEE